MDKRKTLAYEFSKEAEPELNKFMKLCQQQEKRFLETEKLKIWKEITALDNVKINDSLLHEIVPAIETINLTEDDDEEDCEVQKDKDETIHKNKVNETEEMETNNESYGPPHIKDMAYAISEDLNNEKFSETVLLNLTLFTDLELEQLFTHLVALNNEELFKCGLCFLNTSELLIRSFCKHLFIPKCFNDFVDGVLKLLDLYSLKQPSVTKNEILEVLLKDTPPETMDIFLDYITHLSKQFQDILLSEFIARVSDITDNHIKIIHKLVNTETKYENLSRLIQLLSYVAENFARDKTFGALLISIIQCLDLAVTTEEKPLKYLISTHKSIWKAKLSKTFTNCYEESLLMSQTLGE